MAKKKKIEPEILDETINKIEDLTEEVVVTEPVSYKEKYTQICLIYSSCRKNHLRIMFDDNNSKFLIKMELNGKILSQRIELYGENKIETLKIILNQYNSIGYKKILDYIRVGDFLSLFTTERN